MDSNYYIYMLRCSDGSLYTGITTDIERRLAEHLSKGPSAARYTRSHDVEGLACLWETRGRSAASVLENSIKRLNRDQKLLLVEDPELANDLAADADGCVYSPVGGEERLMHWENASSAVAKGAEPVAGCGSAMDAGTGSAADFDAGASASDEGPGALPGAASAGGGTMPRTASGPDAACDGADNRPAIPCVPLVDMHCHLGFASNFDEVLRGLEAHGASAFCNTVTPQEHSKLLSEMNAVGMSATAIPASNDVDAAASEGVKGIVALGLGLHPWWVGDDVDDLLDAFDGQLERTRFVGEIGLDFGKRSRGTAELQVRAFEHIAGLLASRGGLTVSIHTIHSAGMVMDILERTGACESCDCILHWFSGTSEELKRAREMGFRFSVNPMMAKSRRGAEYIKAISVDQLLLETDAPPEGERYGFQRQQEQLKVAADEITAVKGEDAIPLMTGNSLALLS